MKEKVYVVGDLHGCFKEYKLITDYLDEVALCKPEEKVKLIINGDIIDRGDKSIPIIFDIIERQNKSKGLIDIEVLAGNHELMMYEALVHRVNNKWSNPDKRISWFIISNGALSTAADFDKLDESNKEKIINFIEELELQKSYEKEIVGNKGIIIVHSKASEIIKTLNDKLGKRPKIKEVKKDIIDSYRIGKITTPKYYHYYQTLWTRPKDTKDVGLDGYFTIIGHTPVDNKDGYKYDEKRKVLNIDGGCSSINSLGKLEITIPLVEIDYDSNQIIIHRFKNDGQKLNNHYITSTGIKKESGRIKK